MSCGLLEVWRNIRPAQCEESERGVGLRENQSGVVRSIHYLNVLRGKEETYFMDCLVLSVGKNPLKYLSYSRRSGL